MSLIFGSCSISTTKTFWRQWPLSLQTLPGEGFVVYSGHNSWTTPPPPLSWKSVAKLNCAEWCFSFFAPIRKTFHRSALHEVMIPVRSCKCHHYNMAQYELRIQGDKTFSTRGVHLCNTDYNHSLSHWRALIPLLVDYQLDLVSKIHFG